MADVKIDIPGIGEVTADNAASESTLRELLVAMSDGKGSTAPKNVEKLGKASKDAGKEVKGFGEAAKAAAAGMMNGLVGAIGMVVGTATNLASELVAGGNQLSDFTQYLPIPGLQTLSGLIDGQVNLFRDLSQTGASFGNNMFEISRIAGEAAIPQRDFAELLSNNADQMRMFGNTVSDGARNFAGLSKEFRQSTAGQDLMTMGMTTQELNEALLDYNELTIRSGRRRFLNDRQLAQGAAEYAKELDGIAKLTGKSRKQLADEIKQKNIDIRRQMALSKLGEEFGLRLEQASAASPELEAALLDMADGVANDPLTQQLMANSETFRSQAQNIQNMSKEQMANFIQGVGQDSLEFANSLRDAGTQAAIAAGTSAGDLARLAGVLSTARTSVEGAVDAEQTARDQMTTAMTGLAETINEIRGGIIADILDSDIFKMLSDEVGNMVPTLDEAKGMFATFKEKLMPILNQLTQDFITYVPMIQDFFGKLFSPEGREELFTTFTTGLKDWFTGWWAGLSGEDILAGIATGLAAVILGPVGLIGGAIVAGIVATFGWENIKQFFTDAFNGLGPEVTNLVSDAWTNIKDWFSGIFSGLFDFNISLPNFSDYLPKWLGGKGLSWDIFGSSDNPAPSPSDTLPAEEEVSSANTPEVVSPTSTAKQSVTSSVETELAMLNTTATEMRDLIQKSNSILKKLDGNMIG